MTKRLKKLSRKQKLTLLLAVAFLAAFCQNLIATANTVDEATRIRNQLEAVQKKIDSLSARASELATQASTLEGELALLQAQQETVQAEIERNEAEYEQIKLNLENIQNRIKQNKGLIAIAKRSVKFNSDKSDVDRLLSATQSFSDASNNKMRLSSITNTIVDILKENKSLEAEAEQNKLRQEAILADLEAQRNSLTALSAQQTNLLASTRGEEAEYQRLQEEAKTEQATLLEEQRKLNQQNSGNMNILAGDPNKGGYPYSGSCPSYVGNGIDYWRMYQCQCTSYAAWRASNAYGSRVANVITTWGATRSAHAKYWASLAAEFGVPYGTSPRAGSAAIFTQGAYGHVVWVEEVNGSKVVVSDYNYNVDGRYMRYEENASRYNYYIYFGDY